MIKLVLRKNITVDSHEVDVGDKYTYLFHEIQITKLMNYAYKKTQAYI